MWSRDPVFPRAVLCCVSVLGVASCVPRPSFVLLLVPFPDVSIDKSVAPRSTLGRPQLVHLGDALLELDVLALFVCVSLVLHEGQSVVRLSWVDSLPWC